MKPFINFLLASCLVIGIDCQPKKNRPSDLGIEISHDEEASYQTIDILPTRQENFDIASFTMYVPESENIRYIMVAVWGFSQDGRFLAKEKWLKKFVKETNGALIGCYFKSEAAYKREVHYAAAGYGSGAALDSAISKFDHYFPSHRLKDLPLFIWGQSAGGQYGMRRPLRTSRQGYRSPL